MIGRSVSPALLGSAVRGQGIRVSFVSLFVTLLLAQSMVLVTSEIIDLGLNMILDASSDEVHFVRGYLLAPATIDLSNIRWITNEDIIFDLVDDVNDEYSYENIDDAISIEDDAFDETFENDLDDALDDGDDVFDETFVNDLDDVFALDNELVDDVLVDYLDESEVTPTNVPVVEPEDSAGDNNSTKVDDNANDEGVKDNGEYDITGEENSVDKEKENSSDPIISPETEVNDNKENEVGDSGNTSQQPKPTTTDNNEGEPTTTVDENNAKQNVNEQENGKDGSAGETTNEAKQNNGMNEPIGTQNTFNDENNNGGNSEGQEETIINEVGDNADEDQDQQEAVSNSTPSEENKGGSANEELVNGEDYQEEQEFTPVNTSGDKNENGDKGGQEEQESTPVNTSGDKNENGDKGGQEEQESTPVNTSGDKNENGDKGGQEEQELTPANTSGDKNENGDKGGQEEQELNHDEADGKVEDNGDKNMNNKQNDEEGKPSNEDKTENSTSAPTTENTSPSEDGGDRNLQNPAPAFQIVDISLFLVPRDCKKDHWGNCDWVSLGVGSYDDEMEGGMSYCCSKDTFDRGICNFDNIGKIMIDHEIFEGDHRKIVVPSKPLEDFKMDDPFFDVKKSGDYVMIIANCNDDGFGIITLGNMEWKSVGGYLPGDMFGMMFFYGATTAIYLALGLWYYYGMKMFQEAAIPIQKYILGTAILGLLTTAFQGIDLLFWNITGMRSPAVMYAALALGILFQGSLRCLGVMVAMGWGVVRDTLGMELCKIVLLGLLYSGLTLIRDSLNAAASSAQLVSSAEEDELFDLALVLSLVILCINIIFYFWIISSFKTTTEYLKNMNQTSKLRRHLRLRCLIITSLVIIVVLTVVNAVQSLADIVPKVFNADDYPFKPFLNEDQVWIIKAMGYGNYLFILFGVTILWRPNADAKDYAMQMQIPSNADDENDLELSCVVPSADDIDVGEGYKIDDAVAT